LNLKPRIETKILRLSQQEKEKMVNASTIVPLDITLTNAETKPNTDSKGNHSKRTSERVRVTTFQVLPRILETNIGIK